MMTSESAVSATPADNTPTYYVVPVKTGGSGIAVWYYQQLEAGAKWTKVAPSALDATSQGGDTDQVRLVQPSAQEIVEYTNLMGDDLDLTVTLYAAVARTLLAAETLPRNYAAGVQPALTIDVAPGTTRGVTMVFTRHGEPGAGAVNVVELASINEPEIKNGMGDPE